MIVDQTADVLVVIVGFRNAADIRDCLAALSRSDAAPNFDIFICENGGEAAYRTVLSELSQPDGPCHASDLDLQFTANIAATRFTGIHRLQLRARSSRVWIGCAKENLGYAGGINAWLEQLMSVPSWKGAWILNPDTEPEPGALTALIERAETGGKAMVGSTILEAGSADRIRFRGGLHWQKFATRCIAIGLGDHREEMCDLAGVESALDSPSGASTYATRSCIDTIGLMDERFFLFLEDLDWGVRAKKLGLGYAENSVVAHSRGTTTGSSRRPADIPRLSVYLEHRNAIHFVRKHYRWALPLRILISCLYAARFLMNGAPRNARAVFEGLAAGLKGETGRPGWHRSLSQK